MNLLLSTALVACVLIILVLFYILRIMRIKLAAAEKGNLISIIAQALDTESGNDFYQTLIRLLAETLEVDFAFIGRYVDHKDSINAFAVYGHGEFLPEFTYDLKHTPCQTAMKNAVCAVPQGVRNAYPDDEMLVGMDIDAYVGTRLDDSNGNPIGILVALSHTSLKKPDLVDHILRIFGVRVAFEIEREESSKKLSYQAKHDGLTGLINRNELESRLEQHVLSAQRYDEHHALCFIDLDQFKVINDTAGHIAGDALLQQISLLLKEHVRETDTLARIGGDEFSVLMENTYLEQALEKAKEIISYIEDFIFSWENRVYKIGASIGIAQIDRSTSSYTQILKRADIACYAAKDMGRNRAHIYQEKDEELSKKKKEMQWAPKISHALEENGFELFVQEIQPTQKDNKHVNYEVLVRMKNDDGSYISPGVFLPSAERYGLIGKIDYWVIDHVFRWLIQHSHNLPSETYFSINLSGQSLGDEEVLEHVIEWFNADLLPASRIRFEITETMAISNLVQANHFIDAARKYGCGISLDDFGSGLSSFGYLKNLNADTLKIDGLFVRNILTDSIDEALVDSINHIGHLLGMETIAEFVENDSIAEKLREIGVDYLQGYGIAKPMPINNLISPS